MKAVSFLILILLSVSAVFAGDPPRQTDEKAPKDKKAEQKKEKKQEEKAVSTGGAGMVVTIDSQRGTVVEGAEAQLSDEMREALAEMINTSSEGLKEVRLADGTVMVDLQGRFRSAMVATVGSDGKVRTSCLSSDPKHKHADTCNEPHKKKEEKKEEPGKQ